MTKQTFSRAAQFLLFSVLAGAAQAQETPIPKTAPDCAEQPEFAAVDVSMDTRVPRTKDGQPIFVPFKQFGAKTLIRYYDNELESLPTKTLRKAESDAILNAGMAIAVIFQHANNNIGKFLEPDIGQKDAQRALALADENRQPFGTTIYFGIDDVEGTALRKMIDRYRSAGGGPLSDAQKEELGSGPLGRQAADYYENFRQHGPEQLHTDDLLSVKPDMLRPVIKTYFEGIKTTFASYSKQHGGKGYVVGMYCTGLMCVYGKQNALADKYWMNPAERFDQPDYLKFLKSDDWNMVQQLPTRSCGWKPTPGHDNFEFDFNYVRRAKPDFGQWAAKR